MSSSTRTAAVLVIVVAFIAGAVIGIAADHLWLLHRGVLLHHGGGGRSSTSRMADRLDRELHLSAAQKTQVQQILDRHRTKIDALMTSVRPQVRQEVDASNNEIETILTPEQKTKFAQVRMRVETRRRAHDGQPR
jgi:Spy/CpxP family protein refolding chaperone